MGSSSPPPGEPVTAPAPPHASSPSLVLAHPTPTERRRTWSLTHPLWGPALSRDGYLEREAYLTTVPLARDGGITHWILTDSSLPPDRRPVLSSCETLRKRAIAAVAVPSPSSSSSLRRGEGIGGGEEEEVEVGEAEAEVEVEVRDGVAHGIGSVFTEPRFRGRGYAGRMMRELGPALARLQADARERNSPEAVGPPHEGSGVSNGEKEAGGGDCRGRHRNGSGSSSSARSLFSVLYSDIGKTYYASKGWEARESCHVAFPPASAPEGNGPAAGTNGVVGAGRAKGDAGRAEPIGYHELAELCAADERLLRASLKRQATPGHGGKKKEKGKTCAALLPELDAMLWHLMREDYMTKRIFGETPTVKGAVFGEAGRRLWAVWTRGYYGGKETTEGNTLHVLRFVVEDDSSPNEYLVEGFRAVIRVAQAEAARWRSRDVQMWNPTPALRRLIHKSGLDHELVDRDSESIASLMWYGEEPTGDVEWVANEKFGWC